MPRSDTEQKIINAATEIFLQKGRDGARMQDIADRAGINKAMLHYYFRTKHRLYQEVFEEQIGNFLDEIMNSVIDTGDPMAFLKGFIDTYIDAISHRPQVVNFVLWEIERGGQAFVSVAKRVFASHGFTAIPFPMKIQEAIDSGAMRPVDPVQLFMSLIGMCLFPFIARPMIEQLFPQTDVLSSDFLEKRKEEITQLLFQGIAPHSP